MPSFVRGHLTLLAAMLAAAATAVARDADQVDSGWSVPKPVVVPGSVATPAPQTRILLDHVLRQTEEGLQLHAVPTPRSETGIRVAERTGMSGWRPVGIATAPAVPGQTQASGPTSGLSGGNPAAPRVETTPPTASSPSRGWVLEFRTPPTSKPAVDADREPIEVEPAAANVRRPEPHSSDELTPELLPGSIGLRRNNPIVTTTPSPADEAKIAESNDSILPIGSDELTVAKPAEEAPKNVVSQSKSTAPPKPLTPQLAALRTRVRSVLRGYYQKSLNSQDNDPWEIMHGMLAYGIHSRIRQGGPRGEHITAVGWLCYNRPCKGKSLLYVSPEGELRAKQGVGLQGHMGQLLAMLAQCNVSPEYPIRVGNQEFTVQDLIEAEKKTCYAKSELTFKLIAMSHYLDLDATWVNDQGMDWDFSKLISEELAQPIRGAACGGTHRLSGLSLAVKARVKSGGPLDGEYAKADEFVKNYQNYAFRMQNRDGSLSTKWFQGQGDEADTDRRVKTTGHILEWLVYSLSDDELRDPRTVRAVTYLTNLLYSNYDHEWEVGPVSHATHALLLYDERLFQPLDPAGQTDSVISNGRGTRPAVNRGASGRR